MPSQRACDFGSECPYLSECPECDNCWDHCHCDDGEAERGEEKAGE